MRSAESMEEEKASSREADDAFLMEILDIESRKRENHNMLWEKTKIAGIKQISQKNSKKLKKVVDRIKPLW